MPIDKQALHHDLLESFIEFQWRQDNPFPLSPVTKQQMINQYKRDTVFHHKVNSMACGVMHILDKHI